MEIKCPFMGGNPFPYRKVPLLYVPQCQLEMYATNTKTCHFVCWTPRRTYIYLVKRNDKFIQELLAHLKSFWSQALAGEIPTWNICTSTRIPFSSPCMTILSSYIMPIFIANSLQFSTVFFRQVHVVEYKLDNKVL